VVRTSAVKKEGKRGEWTEGREGNGWGGRKEGRKKGRENAAGSKAEET
jgi:hypothetical protein